jgi:D-serine deaminase-like pyridoxal phosphate-dependent protein
MFADLTTPIPVVDLDRLERNLDRMASYASAHGLALRPHIKTHKAPAVARQQIARGAVGLTCATPRELEVMSEVATDLLLAYPPIGSGKIDRVMALPPATRVTIAVDSAAAIEDIAAAAKRVGRPVRILLEIDMGLHRVGITSPADAVALAALVKARPPLEYGGIAFYPGHLRDPMQPKEGLEALSRDIATYVTALERAGLAPGIVSGGSTPTAWKTHEVRGVTEFRPGTYVYNDRMTVELGVNGWEDCAMTVLATIISTSVPGQAIVDAGTKALGREPLIGGAARGYGQILDHPEVIVTKMWEEHGALDLSKTTWRPAVGEQVRIIPNHVCVVTHLFDTVVGVRGEQVETSWPIAARGREPVFAGANTGPEWR